VGFLVDGYHDEVLLKDVDGLGPPFDPRMTFFGIAKVGVVLDRVGSFRPEGKKMKVRIEKLGFRSWTKFEM
jgi:hypothetical protein